MSVSQRSPARPPRIFVVTAYYLRPEGSPVAELPRWGPCESWDTRACRICFHHHRSRKSGPGFPLVVVECRTHAIAFTLYPPGYIPYGRRPMERRASDGKPIDREPRACEDPQVTRLRDHFEGTLLEAALDAAEGCAWPREGEGAKGWWSTQNRHIDRGLRLLGIHPEQGARERERVAAPLRVSTLVLHEACARVCSDEGYRTRGRVLVTLLVRLLELSGAAFVRLLEAGFLLGMWGHPGLWESRLRILRAPPF